MHVYLLVYSGLEKKSSIQFLILIFLLLLEILVCSYWIGVKFWCCRYKWPISKFNILKTVMSDYKLYWEFSNHQWGEGDEGCWRFYFLYHEIQDLKTPISYKIFTPLIFKKKMDPPSLNFDCIFFIYNPITPPPHHHHFF